MASKEIEKKPISYKGFPINRCGDLIYYGNLTDKFIIMMQILEKTKVKDIETASKVLIQLQYSDPDLKARDRVVKTSEKSGLYASFDIANIWLERALAGK